jgi:hypothetical protein
MSLLDRSSSHRLDMAQAERQPKKPVIPITFDRLIFIDPIDSINYIIRFYRLSRILATLRSKEPT